MPAYNSRRVGLAIQALRQRLEAARADLQPRRRFAFSGHLRQPKQALGYASESAAAAAPNEALGSGPGIAVATAPLAEPAMPKADERPPGAVGEFSGAEEGVSGARWGACEAPHADQSTIAGAAHEEGAPVGSIKHDPAVANGAVGDAPAGRAPLEAPTECVAVKEGAAADARAGSPAGGVSAAPSGMLDTDWYNGQSQ